jgi:hypothetical protein
MDVQERESENGEPGGETKPKGFNFCERTS